MAVLLIVACSLMILGLLVIVGMLLWSSASLVTVGIGMVGGITLLSSGAFLMAVYSVIFFIDLLRR